MALELVGTPTLPDTLRATRLHGVVCFTGMLSNQWTVRDFSPNEYLPRGVRLAGYFGDAADLPRETFQEILDAVAAGRLAFPVDRVYHGLEQVPQAHDDEGVAFGQDARGRCRAAVRYGPFCRSDHETRHYPGSARLVILAAAGR